MLYGYFKVIETLVSGRRGLDRPRHGSGVHFRQHGGPAAVADSTVGAATVFRVDHVDGAQTPASSDG